MSADYEVIIAGGGLAGLSLALLLAEKKHRVAVFEKEQYPFHKVCGEYVAMESWDFLQRIGLHPEKMNLPRIRNLVVSSQSGNCFTQNMEPGGFGVSRYLLDATLASTCKDHGVSLFERTKVLEAAFEGEYHRVNTSGKNYSTRILIGCFGKRSNLDKLWNRKFISGENDNWVGVKYHLRREKDDSTIQLHGFEDGYCGINPIEENKYCLCYLAKATQLQRCNKSIQSLEETVVMKNKLLRPFFENRKYFLFQQPVTISQISFAIKEPVMNHVLMLGDAAGMVVPLFGNGMSMAFKSAHLAAPIIGDFLNNRITRQEMERNYSQAWVRNFRSRMRMGKLLQPLFTSSRLASPVIKTLKVVSPLRKRIVNASHGESF